MRLMCLHVFLLVVVTSLCGCGSGTTSSPSGTTNTGSTAGPSSTPSPSSASKAKSDVIVMTPRQVFDAEKEDLVEKLIVPNKGKAIEVSGVIDSLFEIGVALRLDPPIDEFTNTWVVSIKDPGDDNWTHAGTYAPGQTVKLQSNGADNIIDFKWKIVESEPNPAPIIQASELAKAFQASPEETNKKYNGKYIYLVGEIAKQGDDYTWLKGTGDFNLQCIVDSSSVGESTLKEGDQIQLLGDYSGDEKSEPVIGVCILVSPKLPVPGVKYAKDVGPPKQ